MQEYYEVLNLTENATDEEIEKAYRKLKEKYSEERFMDGERGNQAARKLTAVETAYREIRTYRNDVKHEGEKASVNLQEVERFIKEGKLSEAQDLLDTFSERDAEWHYVQSVIFYKKSWSNESKKQLEIALKMEPSNSKYKEAYDKLIKKIEYNNEQFRSGNGYAQGGANPDDPNARQMGGDGLDNCLSFCTTMCCMNMMCNMCCR